MLESGGERGRFAHAFELFHQRLDPQRREVTNNRYEILCRTVFVLHHGVTHAGLVRKIPCGVKEKQGDSLLPFQRLHEGFDRLRENRILRAGGDHFVSVTSENRKNLRTIRGCEMSAAGADSYLSLARGPAMAQIFENFRAQSFHWITASSPSDLAPLYRRRPVRQEAAWPSRSIPA